MYCFYMAKSIGGTLLVHRMEVIRISESQLREVPLYITKYTEHVFNVLWPLNFVFLLCKLVSNLL